MSNPPGTNGLVSPQQASPPTQVPGKSSINTLFVEDIRHFIFDRNLDDNILDMDLLFGELEIKNAMRHAMMSFNNRPPAGMRLNINGGIPHDMWAIQGTVYHLCLSELHKQMKNDITYSAGGVTADIAKTRIKNFKDLLKIHREEFYTQVDEIKLAQNISDGYSVGIG